jgi:hypothetical protein
VTLLYRVRATYVTVGGIEVARHKGLLCALATWFLPILCKGS